MGLKSAFPRNLRALGAACKKGMVSFQTYSSGEETAMKIVLWGHGQDDAEQPAKRRRMEIRQ